tara:strand:- start:632 stop:922 length:291 start_codon:yes stop_codon:yes gene_type:complete
MRRSVYTNRRRKKMGTARKPHNHWRGYYRRRHPSGGHLVIVDANKADMCHRAGKYVVILQMPDDTGYIGPSFTSIPKARVFYKSEIAEPKYDWGNQ